MKILHIITTFGIAGAEKHVQHLLPELKQNGIDCALMLICPEHSRNAFRFLEADLERAGVPLKYIFSNSTLAISSIGKISQYIKQNDYKYIHSHLLKTDVIVTIIKKYFIPSLKILSTKHGYEEKSLRNFTRPGFQVARNPFYYLSKYTFRNIDINIAVSNTIARLFRDFKITKTVLPVIYHGIEMNPVDLEQPGKYKLASEQLVLVGRLEEVKGHRYAIEAMPHILKEFPEVKLLFVGAGSLVQSLKSQAKSLGVEESIEFLGFQSDPYSYIYYSDLLLVPSQFEALGLVFLEGMSLKTPVITFDVPAGNEILDNTTGCLIPLNDSNKMAEKVISMLQQPGKRNEMAEAAYKVFLEKFTISKMVDETISIYRKLDAS
ncbi:MAG: glycosyltransferase family 4 protein [Ferruginibacter sp.]